jgi:hypothetical protein
MQSEQSAGYLKWLVALAIFSPIVSAQTMTIAGQTHDCSWLPALDATLAYNGEGTFAGWTAQDVDSAKALITECERPWWRNPYHNDHRRTEQRISLLQSRWDETQQRAKAEQQREQQAEERSRQILAMKQQQAPSHACTSRDQYAPSRDVLPVLRRQTRFLHLFHEVLAGDCRVAVFAQN